MPLLLALAVAAHFAAGWRMMRAPKISFGDGIEYLDAAYHLRRDQTFTSSSDPGTTTPAIGREPGYPLLLAALMALDPGLGSYSPVCGNSTTACDPARCRTLSIVNLVLIEVASLLVFSLAAEVTGIPPIPARLLSFSVAVLVTFALNHRWTFAGAGSDGIAAAVIAYLGVQGVAFAVNFGIYAGWILWVAAPWNRPLLGLAIASMIGLIVNYAGSRFVVFGRPRGEGEPLE